MTDRASRKRRAAKTLPEVPVPEEPTPQKPAENEGAPPAGYRPRHHPAEVHGEPPAGARGHDTVVLPELCIGEPVDRLAFVGGAVVRLSGEPGEVFPKWLGVVSVERVSESAPYQCPDGSWEVLELGEGGRVTGRRKVEAPR